jgi:hypothetical protein
MGMVLVVLAWVGGGMRKEVDNLICEECGRKVWRVRKGLIT